MPQNRTPIALRAGEGALTGASAGLSLSKLTFGGKSLPALLGVGTNPFVVGFGVAGLLFSIFGGKDEKEDEEERHNNLEKSTIGPARWVYGTARITGDRTALKYNEGGNDPSLYYWSLLSQDETEGIASIWINGIRVALRTENVRIEYDNTDSDLMPGLIGRRMGIVGNYRAGARRYVLGANRMPVPQDDFYDEPGSPQLRTVSWVFQDATRVSLQGTPSAAFGFYYTRRIRGRAEPSQSCCVFNHTTP